MSIDNRLDANADISVIIPFYNGKEWIARSLSSVLSQTLLPKEVVLVDDGSAIPLTYEDVRDVPGMDTVDRGRVDLTILRHDVNRGIPATRNTGIRASTGEWIAFLDQDDEWHLDKLERQIGVLDGMDDRNKPCGIFSMVLEKNVSTLVERVSPKKHEIAMIGKKGIFESLLRYGNFVYWITLMVHRQCFEQVGYLDEKLSGGSDDYDFALRLSSGSRLVFDMGSPVAIHYVHNNNYSHALKFADDNKNIYDKYSNMNHHINSLLSKAKSRNYYMEGRYWHVKGDYKIAKGIYKEAILSSPSLRNISMFCICICKDVLWKTE